MELKQGHSDPAAHNAGDVASEFTSWTVDEGVAHDFATKYGESGVILTKDFPQSRLVKSPDVLNEGEVLVTGEVTGAAVRHVDPK